MLTKRRLIPMASLAAIAAIAVSAIAANGEPSPSAGPSGVTINPLAHATIAHKVRVHSAGIKISTKGPRDLLTASITVDPAGSFGWHTHPGPVVVAVASGTLTLYEVHHHRCTKQRIGPGRAFVENGGHLHLARNEGSDPVQIYATFLAPTNTKEFLTPAPDPGVCRL
jgi:quercetin dioxygenase-like cupin family protein